MAGERIANLRCCVHNCATRVAYVARFILHANDILSRLHNVG